MTDRVTRARLLLELVEEQATNNALSADDWSALLEVEHLADDVEAVCNEDPDVLRVVDNVRSRIRKAAGLALATA